MTIFLIVAGAASIVGAIALPLSIQAWRSGGVKKALAFQVSPPVPLAAVLTSGTELTFTITYDRAGEEPTEIKGAYIHFLRIANLGTETIRRNDLETSDALRIEVEGSRVLDIALAAATRDVIGMSLGTVKDRSGPARSRVQFDFLDRKDGALVRVLTEGPEAAVRLVGTVIGIPEGPQRVKSGENGFGITGWGCLPLIVLEGAVVVLAGYLSAAIFGDDFSWGSFWLVLIPVGVGVAFALVLLAVALIWPNSQPWPDAIKFPAWFTLRTRVPPGALWPYEFEPTAEGIGREHRDPSAE